MRQRKKVDAGSAQSAQMKREVERYKKALDIIRHGTLPDGDGCNLPTMMFAEDVLEGNRDEFLDRWIEERRCA